MKMPTEPSMATVEEHPKEIQVLLTETEPTHETPINPDDLPNHPTEMTGELETEPWKEHLYPDNPQKLVSLLTGQYQGSEYTQVHAEEFNMQIQRMQGVKASALPSQPFTPEKLDYHLRSLLPIDRGEYDVMVTSETEIMNKTAVGEYRDAVDGDILQFRLEYDQYQMAFTLAPTPDDSLGFAWYSSGAIDKEKETQMAEMSLSMSHSQPLSTLTEVEDNPLMEMPESVRSASHLLGKRLSPRRPSAAPRKWVTTKCERKTTESKVLEPRYEASFVHKPTDTVLMVSPLDNTDLTLEERPTPEKDMIEIGPSDDTDRNKPTHKWELEFAPSHVEKQTEAQFPKQVKGERLHDIMTAINSMVDQSPNNTESENSSSAP